MCCGGGDIVSPLFVCRIGHVDRAPREAVVKVTTRAAVATVATVRKTPFRFRHHPYHSDDVAREVDAGVDGGEKVPGVKKRGRGMDRGSLVCQFG